MCLFLIARDVEKSFAHIDLNHDNVAFVSLTIFKMICVEDDKQGRVGESNVARHRVIITIPFL
jgi:hypothetical protein